MKPCAKAVLTISSLLLLSADADAFSCRVTSTPVSFGSYDVFAASPLDGVGTINLSCSNPERKPLQVEVSVSSGQSGAFNPRQMQRLGGADRLNYYLFLDASKTTVWGDGTGGSSTFSSDIQRNPDLTAVVYGRIPAKQDIAAGSYGDALLVTVTW